MISLSSCFSTIHPDMVEYTEEKVLSAIKEKYNVSDFIFTGSKYFGEVSYDDEGSFKIKSYNSNNPTNFINGDNIETAMTAFAGKNGGHDIQGMYSRFLCYLAMGKCNDEKVKFFYYNTNINKNAVISDTIGASDYPYDILPTEITIDSLNIPQEWNRMVSFIEESVIDKSVEYFSYSSDKLMISNSVSEIKFYRENDNIKYDIYYINSDDKNGKRQLVYSSSDRYGVIYKHQGIDESLYFDIQQKIEPSTSSSDSTYLEWSCNLKENSIIVLYSFIDYRITYFLKESDGKFFEHSASDTKINNTSFVFKRIISCEDSELVFLKGNLTDFYIFYEKVQVEK